MANPIIECVPNFSEGRDPEIIEAIANAIRTIDGVKLLDVDPGKSTNRTVYTFAGAPSAVIHAAIDAARVGASLIDMRKHKGEHPRFGFMDVCPIIPIRDCTMEDAVKYAHELSHRLAQELELTIFNYGNAASSEDRRDLSTVRAGEYEGLREKLMHPDWKPDYGPMVFNDKLGATAVGAREILVAYNINLNTTSVRRANSVAFDVREKGRAKRTGDPITGEIVKDQEGNTVYEPGVLRNVKGIGWYIEEYGICQVSMNLTNVAETPLHVAFDETVEKARLRGIRVTGSELVGLVPLKSLLEAGRYFLRKQKRSTGVSDQELVKIAVRSLGLDELSPFDPKKKVIEYALQGDVSGQLVDMTLADFVRETASESPAPGGGSIAATMGAMGAALGMMVANLSSHKRGWDERWEEFSDWAEKGKGYQERLLHLIDEDTQAFNELMKCFGRSKSTEEQKAERDRAIQEATKRAVEVPLEVMQVALDSMEVIRAMADIGNPNSVSDAGVGALAARSAVLGAHFNVKINCSSIMDKGFVEDVLGRAATIRSQAEEKEAQILALVEAKL